MLNGKKKRRSILPAPLWSVDADVIVPSILLEKEQFAARTIRPRIRGLLAEFLKPVKNPSVHVPWQHDQRIRSLSVSPELIHRLHIDRSVSSAVHFPRRHRMRRWLHSVYSFRERLRGYAFDRNKPEIDGTSRLSPYLHFGQIGPHTVALVIQDAVASARDRDTFLEELMVRRELAVNFVRYNPRFATLASIEPWARRTIDDHARDTRSYILQEREAAG